MKKFLAVAAFTLVTSFASAQYKMDSDGKTLRNSSNSSVGRIDSDGKTIRNSSNSSVLRIDGNDIRNSSNSTIAKMSDVTNDIKGAKPEAVYVALWWFIVKGNK